MVIKTTAVDKWTTSISSILRYLVWLEAHDTPIAAITREKQIKKWRREWKIRLIEEFNPAWKDLYAQIAS